MLIKVIRNLTFPFLLFIVLVTACRQSDDPDRDQRVDEDVLGYTQGLNRDSLNKALVGAASLDNLYALVVIKDDQVVIEKYYNGKTSNSLLHLRSITKNVTSAIAGIAIDKGLVAELDETLAGHYEQLLETDKSQITFRHLLNMTSGLEWNEEEEIIGLIQHMISNPVGNFLSRSLISDPGTTFNYSTLSSHVAADFVSSKADQSFEDFVSSALFIPLGISNYQWETDPEGNVWGGMGLQLTAIDLAKFGQLYLNEGVWETTSVISENWVGLSTTAQLQLPNSQTGYSLKWYVADHLNTKIYYGQGFGGQTLMLFPEKNMLMVAFQEHLVSFDKSSDQWSNFLSLVFNPIYGAIE